MGNVIRGGIGVLFGLGVLIYFLVAGDKVNEPGKIAGLITAILLIGAGAFYLVMGLRKISEEPPKKRKKKKKRPRKVEED